jgi:hypothetical protein
LKYISLCEIPKVHILFVAVPLVKYTIPFDAHSVNEFQSYTELNKYPLYKMHSQQLSYRMLIGDFKICYTRNICMNDKFIYVLCIISRLE